MDVKGNRSFASFAKVPGKKRRRKKNKNNREDEEINAVAVSR